MSLSSQKALSHSVTVIAIVIVIVIITRFSCLEARCTSADKLRAINHGHGAQYLYRPLPAGANVGVSFIITVITHHFVRVNGLTMGSLPLTVTPCLCSVGSARAHAVHIHNDGHAEGDCTE